jgi:hypothetical protein
VVLAGGPFGAWPATLLVRSRLAGALAGRLGVAARVGGALLGMDPLDGAAGPLPCGSLSRVLRLGAKRPLEIRDLVGAPVLLDLGRGLAPGPPTPDRLGHRPQGLQGIAGPVGLDGHAGGPPLPGQGPDHLPIFGTQVGVGLQPAVAALLVLTNLALAVVSPVSLLGRHRQSTRHAGGLVAAAQPAKHVGALVAGGLLVSSEVMFGLRAVGGGPAQLPAPVAGSLVQLVAQPVPLGPQLRRRQPPQIRAAGSVEGQGLATSPRQDLG